MAIFNPGDQVGRYTIEALVAGAHRYECYRATSAGRSFALKVPALENLHRNGLADDLLNQAVFLAPERCRVGRIAHYVDVFPAAGAMAVVMPFIEGRPLTEYLDPAELDWDGRMALLRALASTLDGLHAHGIVHRDVSDKNVIVDASLLPVLIDFDLSSELPVVGDWQVSLTSGSRFFKAPEQWVGAPQDHTVDLFAFALLCAYVLGCCQPEKESHAFIDIEEFPAWLPRSVARRLEPALARDPGRRPRTCTSILSLT